MGSCYSIQLVDTLPLFTYKLAPANSFSRITSPAFSTGTPKALETTTFSKSNL